MSHPVIVVDCRLTRRGRVQVECVKCCRDGWWNWERGVVEHGGFGTRNTCYLNEPTVRVRRAVDAA